MKQVLIVTQKIDPHSDVVIKEIQNLGGAVLRLNTELFLNYYQVDFGLKNQSLWGHISDNFGRTLNLTNAISAYYRRPTKVFPHSELSLDGAKDYSAQEGELALSLLYNFPNLKWVNSPYANKQAQVKLNQLYTANALGLRIPNTLVTNKPQIAKEFIKSQNNNVICKSIDTNSVKINNKDVHMFSHRLTPEDLEKNLDAIRFTPTLIQEYIEKKNEIRVNVIGNKVFATEIESQRLCESKDDWRKADPFSIPHKAIELPMNLQSSLVSFVKKYNLHFSAIDLIKTPSGEFVFLENNPNGQWFWIELLTKQPLARSIAELLLSKE